jgi:DNA invertase Pin-like site-specific DNA recombinase
MTDDSMIITDGDPSRCGYARVSTKGQNDDSQVAELTAANCGRIYVDHGVSGKKASRPQLDRALASLQAGDSFVITRLSRAMRSIHNLLDLINGTAANGYSDGFKARDINLIVLKQSIDTSTPTGRLTFHLMAAFDEFLRELIVEGTKEGLAVAKANGKKLGGPPKLTPAQEASVLKMRARGTPFQEIGEAFGVSHMTIRRITAKAEKVPAA